MPNSFRPLKGNCPICSGARRDCRENTHASLIHCRHDVATVTGFRFVGTDAHGFNMWAVDDGKSRSDADWETQRKQKAADRERRLREDAFHYAALLSVEERDHNIRKIHAQLGLTTRHRQNLRSRRLSDAEIDAGKFFSIDPWCSVLGINPQLAGVDLNGKHLTIGQPGFACPIWDDLGRIIGWQTRFDDAKSNKYRWPTSRSQKRPNGATAHLPNGELPISCCRPVGVVSLASIGLAEGFLKSYVAAQKLGQIVIGAAGGNFAGSPQQLKAYLDALSAELDTKTVDLYPDAGALTNKTVMGHYERTIKLLQSWGYTVRVAWWGQYTKDQPDIDERESFDATAYLTTENFLENSLCSSQKTVSGDAAPFEGGPDTIIWARFLDGYNPNGRSDWSTAIDPIIPESERHLKSINSLHIHKVTGAIKSLSGSDPKAVYDRMKEIAESGIYRELTQLTHLPWKEINTPKLDLERLGLEPGAIYVIRSAKGTHKTNSLVPITPKFSNVYAWFNRIALGREECHRIGLEWKDDLKGFRGNLKVGFCADSSFSFPPGLLKNNGLLLVDEADQVFEHMFGDTCNSGGKRPLVLAALKAQLDTVIAGDGIALFMSADITDKEVDYLNQLAPDGCPVRLIVNHYQPELGDVYFYESSTPDGLIENLLQDLENSQPRFVIDDMKNGVRGCKSIAEYIRLVHPEWANEIVEINSDTSGDPAIIEYLKNINTHSQTTRLLCCSPSVVSGISIENGHFQQVYAFLNGVLTISQGLQAAARVRGADVLNIWAAEKGLIYSADRSLFPEQIKGYYNRNYSANSKHLLAFGVQYNPLKDEWDSPHFDLYCKYAAYRNNCMSSLRTRLKERLIKEGYQVFSVASGGSDMVKAGLKDAWTNLEITHAKAVAAAIVLTDAQLEALQNVTLTPQQKLDVEKTYLLKSYGQELIDSMVFEHKSGVVLTGWPAMVLKDNRGQYRKQLDAFYLLIAEEAESITKDLKAEKRQASHGAGRFPADVRWHTRQRRGRQFFGLHKFLDPQLWWEPADFAALCQKARKHAGLVKDAFSFNVEKMTNGQIIGEMIAQLGLDLEKKWASGTSKNGRRYKLRRITLESYRYAQMYVSYRQSLTEASNASPHSAGSASVAPSHQGARVNTDPAIKSDAPSTNLPKNVRPSVGSICRSREIFKNGRTFLGKFLVPPDNTLSGEALEASVATEALLSPLPIICDHPSGDLFSEVLLRGDPGLSLTGQAIEVVSSDQCFPENFTPHPTQPPVIEGPDPMEIAAPTKTLPQLASRPTRSLDDTNRHSNTRLASCGRSSVAPVDKHKTPKFILSLVIFAAGAAVMSLVLVGLFKASPTVSRFFVTLEVLGLAASDPKPEANAPELGVAFTLDKSRQPFIKIPRHTQITPIEGCLLLFRLYPGELPASDPKPKTKALAPLIADPPATTTAPLAAAGTPTLDADPPAATDPTATAPAITLPKSIHPSAHRLVTPTDNPKYGWIDLGRSNVAPTSAADPPLAVGDWVLWVNAPAHWSDWGALRIREIAGSVALLDWSYLKIPLKELRLVHL